MRDGHEGGHGRPGAGRRELAVTVLACAAAAGIALYLASRTWLLETVDRPAPIPDTTAAVSGGALVPALPALALVALAASGALIATRGRGRVAVAALLVLCGAGIATLTVRALLTRDGIVAGWPLACLPLAVMIVTGGVVTARRGGSWPGLGTRYERRRRDQASLWDRLEDGEDPTKE